MPVTTETFEGVERVRLWALVTSKPGNYESHHRRAKGVRELPVVVLRRRPASAVPCAN
jgi:hypothetical protein